MIPAASALSPEDRLSAVQPDPCLQLGATPPQTCSKKGHPGIPCNRPHRFARDVIELARFLAANRQRLPKYIFWMDARPQHFPPYGPYQGVQATKDKTCAPANSSVPLLAHTWRNDVAGAILAELAPFVHRIHSDAIMMPRSVSCVEQPRLFKSLENRRDLLVRSDICAMPGTWITCRCGTQGVQ